MSGTAPRLLSIAEFLVWDDGGDRRHELIEGVPVAMAPASGVHARITANLVQLLDQAVRDKRPCRALPAAGVRIAEGPPGEVYVPDVLVTCEPIDERVLFEAPRLVVEILSPSTGRYDRLTKLPIYGRLGSVEEIWLVGSTQRLVQLYERLESGWHAGLPLIGKAAFPSRVLGVAVALDEVYALTALA